ncbi:MAG: hypothetical protein ABIB04_02575 [Patescibacteria group bacterium]
MFLRFLAIATLKWFTLHFLSALLIVFVLPASWQGFELSIPVWILSFAVAFGFAEWAFKLKIPDKKTISYFLIIWIIASFTLQILQAQFIMGSALYAINSIDMYVQYLLEIAAILLAARATTIRKFHSVMSEGMED